MAREYIKHLADGVYEEEGSHCVFLFGAGSVPRAGHGGLKQICLPKEPSFFICLYILLAKRTSFFMLIGRFTMRSLVLEGFKADLLRFPEGSEF